MTVRVLRRRSIAMLCVYVALSTGCGTVPEEGTIDTRAEGLKPKRIQGRDGPAVVKPAVPIDTKRG
jgi:hypothetical protein